MQQDQSDSIEGRMFLVHMADSSSILDTSYVQSLVPYMLPRAQQE